MNMCARAVLRPAARLGVVLLVAVLVTLPGNAQTFRGGIEGTVTDSTGAAVPQAQITATSTGTGLVRTAQTDDQGFYFINELPLGTYTVMATKSGFRTAKVEGVKVEVSARDRVNLTLQPGQVQETVEVSGSEVPLVETTVDNMGGTLEAKQVEQLPVNGRDFTKLLVLVPGSTADPAGVSDSPGSFAYFSVNGNRGRSDNFLLDGTDMNDGFRNDPAINEGGVFGVPATLLPVDAVAAFAILSGTEAEYGRNSGAIVNIVTKSGTNDLHGSLFEYFRNNHLDARNFFNTTDQVQDLFLNNQFGGSLGGPIIKDKTFFFVAYEGQREKAGFPSPVTIPTQAQITAAGGVTNTVIGKLLARNPWTAPNPLPANATSPGCTAVSVTGLPPSCQMTATVKGLNRLDSVIGKIDQHIGKNDLFTGRYFFGDSNQSFPLSVAFGSLLPGFNTVVPTRVQIVSLSGTHIFSPRLLAEVRGGWNRFAETFTPEDITFDPNSIGLQTVPSSASSLFGMPRIAVTGYNSIGASGSVPRGRVDTNWQYFTNISYTTGRHNWKTGFEFRRTSINSFLDGGFRGNLAFNSLTDFLSGTVDGGGETTGDTHRHSHQNSYGFYVQDNFRMTRRLTFNYGLRWDYFGVIGEKNNLFSIYNAKTDSLQPVGSPGLDKLYPGDYKNFSPRISLAYDLSGNGKTVLRAGWGLYFDAFSQDYFLDQSFNTPTGNFGPAYDGPVVLTSGSPIAVLNPAPGNPVFPASTFSGSLVVFSVDQNTRTPYVQNYNLNIQQQLGGHTALQVGYVGSQGRKLFRFRDINQASAVTPTFGLIDQLETTSSSQYNSLQASLKMNNFHGLTSTVNYTWSHSIDNASDGFDFVPQATFPDNSLRPDREKGNSNFDVRQRFSWIFTYELPGSSWAPKLTKGWAIDGVLTLITGTPVNLITGAADNNGNDFNGSFEFLDRPDLVGNPFAGTSLPNNWLNATALAVPCTWVPAPPLPPPGTPAPGVCAAGTQHFGNVRRNAFTGPHFRNFDFSISKTTPLTERVKAQFRADFFNVFNHPNFSNPVLPSAFLDFLTQGAPDINGRGIGFIPITATPDVGSANPFLGGGGPRNIQFAVKLLF